MAQRRDIVSFFILLTSLNSAATMDLQTPSRILKFSMEFCNELDKSKSVVSSPLSTEFVLGLLSLGAAEPAHSELLTSLGFPNDDDVRSAFTAVSSQVEAIKGITMNLANKIYVKDGGYDLVPELKDDAVNVFDAEIEKINFNNSTAAADLINNWVESKTNNKIKKLFSADSLDSQTSLVLVNALYFKGNWKIPFNSSRTSERPFFVKNEESIEVPMMYNKDEYKYRASRSLQAKLLELPYVGDEASMLIVLPDEIEGLDNVLQKLADGYNIMEEVDKMDSKKVNVFIPKFKIETEIDLGSLLPKLGINAIFNQGNSGLTKILDNNESLYVSKAVQKAFIEVNEEGAEAAASTGTGIMPVSAIPLFRANRPFLYVLVGPDYVPYFMGMFRGSS